MVVVSSSCVYTRVDKFRQIILEKLKSCYVFPSESKRGEESLWNPQISRNPSNCFLEPRLKRNDLQYVKKNKQSDKK